MSTPKYMITNESVTLTHKGQTYTVKSGDPNFQAARMAIAEERWDDVPMLVSKGLGVSEWASQVPGFAFIDGFMQYCGDKLPSDLHERMVKMAKEDADPTFLMRFWERLQENPSWRSVQQLYPFLMHQGIAIDQDGYLLTYKSVRRDYKDHYSGNVDNSIGQEPEMPRNRISDDPNKGCHYGYHVGALAYAKYFGPTSDKRIVICRVDPKDVVCIPVDTSHQKMRVCRYKVIGHYGDILPDTNFDTEKDLLEDEEDDLEDEEDDLDVEEDDLDVEEDDFEPEEVAWDTFDQIPNEDLGKQNLGNLRKYARHVLQIIGASKIQGGKPALLARIFDVRTT